MSLGLLSLVGVNLVLSIMYAMTPLTAMPIRYLISVVELGCMVLTMGVGLRWLLESF